MSQDYANSVNQILEGMEQGLVSPEDVENLNKAITAGYGGAGKPTDLTYGGVIQAESLESTLKSITFDMKNLKFWPAISVDKAYNLFEQYNRLISYGSDSQPYMGEGGAPQEEDSTYVRDGQRIVFWGTRRKVSHQMTLVRTVVGDVVAQQAKEGTMHLLKNVERELYWGHAHYANPASGVQSASLDDLPAGSLAVNGLLQQLTKGDLDVQQRSGDFEGYGDFSSIGLNLAGATIAQDDIERQAVVALENFGAPDQLHIEPIALSAFVRQFYPQFRSAPGLSNQTVGYDVNKMATTAGTIDLKPNLFLRPRGQVRPRPVNRRSPSAPSGFNVTTPADANSSLAAGTYSMALTFVNDHGESAPFTKTSGVVADGDAILLDTIAGASADVKYMKLYRSAVGGAAGSERFVANYKLSAGARDIGAKLPGLGEAFLLDMGAETMRFKQLAPLSKINFAIVTTALEFAIALYGALFVYAPRFNVFFSNLGK